MARHRKLTSGEIALARAAFGDRIDYGRVRLREGPGRHPFAHLAFAKGNPAITIGSTVYFKKDYCDDFAVPGRNRKSFIHEMTHVWQYQLMGQAAFYARYGAEFVKSGARPADMYKYEAGMTRFGEAMLEAQADMVGDYSEALWQRDAGRQATLGRNLRESGLYDL